MFKPVDPKYLATITEMAPSNPPNRGFLRVAYLTRQYGSQELNSEYPPACSLHEEQRLSITEQAGGGHNYAALCEKKTGGRWTEKDPKTGRTLDANSCFMRFNGQGDVHYRTFGSCYYDDQSAGMFVAV